MQSRSTHRRASCGFGARVCIVVAAAVWIGIPAFAQPTPANLDRAQALLTAGQIEDARAGFESTLQADPGNLAAQQGEVEASERLALKARAAGDNDSALRDLLRARELAPHNGHLLYDLGVLEDEMRLFKDADASLAAAEKLIPGDLRLLYATARVKLDLGQLGPAEDKMNVYLKQRPDDATAHYGLGRVYQLGLQFDKARVEFQRSIDLSPRQTEAYYQLGDMAVEQGDFSQAIEDFNKTLSRNPKHAGALAGMGQACFKQKDYSKALRWLRDATAAEPTYQPGHYFLGLTLARLGKEEESNQELATAVRLADAENESASHRQQLHELSAGH